MVGHLAAHHALSKEVVEGVSERTGGVPLFVEEVTRLLLERGVEGGAQAIPPTLQQSLAARLDRLGEAREIAQIGAVLGRDFSFTLLRAAAAIDDRRLQSALNRLAAADLLMVEGAPPKATYRFKHALIQDAAYDSLLKSRRQALHRRAAEILRDDEERSAAEPELIARHFTEAGLDDLAVEWWGKAGDQALRRSAFQEAIAHLGKAIAMADKAEAASTPHGTRDAVAASQRLKLQTDYARAVMYSRGFIADETKAAFARAAELAAEAGDFSEHFAAAHGLWTFALVRGELKSGAPDGLDVPGGGGEARSHGGGWRRQPRPCHDHQQSRRVRGGATHAERALATCSPERDRESRERFSEDTGLTAMSWLALALWQLGEVDRARELVGMANRRAAELGHAPSMAHPLQAKFFLEFYRGDAAAALAAAEALEALSRQHGMTNWRFLAQVRVVCARCRLFDPAAGMADLQRASEAWTEQGLIGGWLFEALLAEHGLRAHEVDGALSRIDGALALVRRGEGRADLPFAHLLRGEILVNRDPANPALAEEAFQTAIAIATEQGARSWGLRATLALAGLYQTSGRASEAHAVLAPALEGFSPTPELPEIAEAQALLLGLNQSAP